jgi:hypothetical protein
MPTPTTQYPLAMSSDFNYPERVDLGVAANPFLRPPEELAAFTHGLSVFRRLGRQIGGTKCNL